jgi:predicted aldo/keto reductase-like oxidoreductase
MELRDPNRREFMLAGMTGLMGLRLPLGAEEIPVKNPGDPAPFQPKIVTRKLGRTGLELPVVSMGVMNADNPNLVRSALEMGIVLLDTAHVYQGGRNEEMIGEVLKGRKRDSFVIATKVVPDGLDRKTGLPSDATSAEAFLAKLDISLRRLGLDHVDILYLHNIRTREAALHETLLQALQKARQDGKTRFIGLSTHSNEPEVIRAAVESQVHQVVLTAYNFRQDHRDEVRKAIAGAAKAGLGIVAMKTQAGVFWDKERQSPINMQAALKWVLQDPNVHTTIPGFTAYDQLLQDVMVMTDLKLTEQEEKDLNPPKLSAGLYCQGCDRCRPQCPAGLPVPELMRAHMYARSYRNLGAARELVASLELPADPCGGCSTCRVNCAKGFDVRARTRDIARIRDIPADLLT